MFCQLLSQHLTFSCTANLGDAPDLFLICLMKSCRRATFTQAKRPLRRGAAMPKFQRQATHANESDILQIIDERFEELEETVALARLISQIHDRLFEVEQMLKRLEARGTKMKDSERW